ncbi:MAG: hypothetical protein IT496_04325 [Gammaproteobacteria bacterium]|nr:hypothetical protein [Gammaproteobacteria bacterium]
MSAPEREVDDPRRGFLIALLSAGAYMLCRPPGAAAGLLGTVPRPLPPGRSVHAYSGGVRVNGRPVDVGTLIRASDVVETDTDGKLVFVVGKDAFLLRGQSRLEMLAAGAEQFAVGTLRLVTGRLLSVFGKTTHRVETVTATIGIRGTGLYVDSQPDRSYVCTCYGTTEISAVGDPQSSEIIKASHHDAPRYVLAAGSSGKRIEPAPFKDHTDEELELLEALVGRTPPFRLPGDAYGRPRRNTY